jgi:hypothetical protein
MRTLLVIFAAAMSSISFLHAQDILGAGRAIPPGFQFEIYGGVGSMENLTGGVKETKGGGLLSGGLTADLEELGIDEDISTWFWGARAYNPWVTFLFDYRSSSLEASGTADREYRLEVDSVAFAGLDLDYLLIPVNTEYDISAETNWLGLGLRVTPFTIFPEGRVRITPWVHLGVQIIQAEYDIDAGASVDIASFGLPSRVYAERGQASGKEEAGIPEYGIGGEVRLLLGNEPKGAEIVGQFTYKLLDFQGAIDSLGADAEDFEDIDFTYTALEANIFLVYPLNDGLDLLAGVYVEQVDISAVLDSDDRFGSYEREIDVSYSIYGLRAGLRF